jgi:hypothetical protein
MDPNSKHLTIEDVEQATKALSESCPYIQPGEIR